MDTSDNNTSINTSTNTFTPINVADTPATCELYLVRHGERLDEAPDASIANDRPWWDPPLTTSGHSQARGAAERLRDEHARSPFACVYASPTCRTIQTARHVAAALDLPLVLVPGLAECAAAVCRTGLPNFDPRPRAPTDGLKVRNAVKGGPRWKQKAPPRFLTPSEAQERPCPANTSVVCTAEPPAATDADAAFDPYGEEFSGSVERLAKKHMRTDGRILLVTHREGIADLAQLSGVKKRIRSEYCAIARFAYNGGGRYGAFFELVSPPAAPPPRPVSDKKPALAPRKEEAAAPPPPPPPKPMWANRKPP